MRVYRDKEAKKKGGRKAEKREKKGGGKKGGSPFTLYTSPSLSLYFEVEVFFFLLIYANSTLWNAPELPRFLMRALVLAFCFYLGPNLLFVTL